MWDGLLPADGMHTPIVRLDIVEPTFSDVSATADLTSVQPRHSTVRRPNRESEPAVMPGHARDLRGLERQRS